MCSSRTSTGMTSDPKLRMALRMGNFVKNTPNTTRDPTYLPKQYYNKVGMPCMVVLRTSNTPTAPTAAKRILRVAVS